MGARAEVNQINALPERVIRPKSGFSGIDFEELYRYRQLLYVFTWRDILVRYKQTAIGILWALVRPFLTMVVFTVIFGRLARLPSDGVPYPVLTFAGLLPWQFFANSLTESSSSVVANSNMITKIYFPRVFLPASSVLSALVDFFISLAILIGLFAWYGIVPSINVFYLPAFLLLAFLAALGAGLWLSAFNVEYRDFRYVVPFVAQLGLYVSPVGFSSSIVPEGWKFLYSLNPMVGVIDGFRWSLLGGQSTIYLPGLLVSVVVTLLVFFSGVVYFRKVERTFADVI